MHAIYRHTEDDCDENGSVMESSGVLVTADDEHVYVRVHSWSYGCGEEPTHRMSCADARELHAMLGLWLAEQDAKGGE